MIKMTSDGTAAGTIICDSETGQKVGSVVRATIDISCEEPFAVMTLVINKPVLEVLTKNPIFKCQGKVYKLVEAE